jgi:hypothetical protein
MTTQQSLTKQYETLTEPREEGALLPSNTGNYSSLASSAIKQAKGLMGKEQPQEQEAQQPAEISPQKKWQSYLDKQSSVRQQTPSPATQKDLDDEPHGFDASDKMCMLGALATGGFMGVTDTAARTWQLIGKGEEMGARAVGAKHWADNMAGGMKDFTDWYNREKTRSKLYKEAIHSHPIAYELGNLAGSVAMANPFLKGMGALFSGEKLAADAEEAVNTVSNIAKEAGGDEGFTKIIGSAVKKAAAKGIINANKTVSPMTMAKWAGQGAVLGEMQYDPENNHYVSNAVAGGLMGLTFGAGGKLFKAFATPLANEISQISQKSGISLPIKPSLEKIAKWLPFSGYGKLVMDRAKQVVGKVSEVMKGEKVGIDAMARDLDSRIQDLSTSLTDTGLNDYERSGLTKELNNLQSQRADIGSKVGYNQYMFGKAKQALDEHKKDVSDLNDKINKKMETSPTVEMVNTQEEAARKSRIYQPH